MRYAQLLILPLAATAFMAAARVPTRDSAHAEWRDYGGAEDSAQYSSLAQIDRSNVRNLRVAWTYSTGDQDNYSFNPVVAHGLIYVLAKNNSLVALNAATGKEVWTHETGGATKLLTKRGINYWESKDGSDRRLLFARDNILQELDARTGKGIASFGIHGRVDLRAGLGRDPATLSLVQSTTPGRVFQNLIILGSATNQGYGSAAGDVRAFDVRTGKQAWIFHTVPHPGEFGYETWPKDAWKTVGGANSWSELSLDSKRGIVYIPTASPKYNFYGGDRKGADLFGDCLVALDARTGKRLWHFQMVHHDIWDYDNATAPKLLTVRHNGKLVAAVAQAGKEGFLWVFDRVSGEPLWPIAERPVPKSDVPGEETWPTQPYPLKPPPFSRQTFTAEDVNSFTDAAERTELRERIAKARNEGLFTPPSLNGTIEMPGNNGGSNWGGAAVDPANGVFFVVSKDLPCLLKLEPDKTGRQQYTSGFGFLFTKTGLPVITPPWSSLTAYDLNEGTIKWRIPLGAVPELEFQGIHDTGTVFPKVGPVVTAGKLIFTGTRDRKVRAFDTETGKLVWETSVGAAVEGVPAVYEIDGREFIVFCAAAQSALQPKGEDRMKRAYVAFSLPQ